MRRELTLERLHAAATRTLRRKRCVHLRDIPSTTGPLAHRALVCCVSSFAYLSHTQLRRETIHLTCELACAEHTRRSRLVSLGANGPCLQRRLVIGITPRPALCGRDNAASAPCTTDMSLDSVLQPSAQTIPLGQSVPSQSPFTRTRSSRALGASRRTADGASLRAMPCVHVSVPNEMPTAPSRGFPKNP